MFQAHENIPNFLVGKSGWLSKHVWAIMKKLNEIDDKLPFCLEKLRDLCESHRQEIL